MKIKLVVLCCAALAGCGGGGGGGSGPSVASISLSPSTATLAIGATQAFTATAKDSSGNTLSGISFAWASSSASIASVDTSGLATGLASGTTTITASAQGVTSAAADLTVSASTNVAYYIPYTVLMGSSQSPTGLYLVSAASPSATPTKVVTTALDTAQTQGLGYATLYSWTYNAATQQATGLQPALEVYGSGGHLYQVSLTDPSGGAQQLSSSSYTTLCYIFARQQGPFGGPAPQYIEASVDTVAGDNCNTPADVQLWEIPAGAGAATAPTVLPAGAVIAAVLWDTATGLVTGMLIQNGSELDFYDTGFAKQKALLTGLTANSAFVLGEINGTALVDEQTYNNSSSPKTSSDVLYLVTSVSATQVASYSTYSGSPYFSTAACSGTTIAKDFTNYIFGTDAGSQFVYSYPDSSGSLNIYALAPTGTTPTTVLTTSGLCFNGFDSADSSRVMFNAFTTNNSVDDSISLAGPATQTPLEIAGPTGPNTGTSVLYVVGGDAWLSAYTCTNGTCSVTTGVSVADTDTGAQLQSFPNAELAGDVWDGYDPDLGILRGPLILATLPGSGSCTAAGGGSLASGLETVDTSTFTATALPTDGGFAECFTAPDFFGPGPVLLGSLAAQNGNYAVTTLFLGSVNSQVNQNLATPPSGASTASGSPFVNLLQSTSGYFGD